MVWTMAADIFNREYKTSYVKNKCVLTMFVVKNTPSNFPSVFVWIRSMSVLEKEWCAGSCNVLFWAVFSFDLKTRALSIWNFTFLSSVVAVSRNHLCSLLEILTWFGFWLGIGFPSVFFRMTLKHITEQEGLFWEVFFSGYCWMLWDSRLHTRSTAFELVFSKY